MSHEPPPHPPEQAGYTPGEFIGGFPPPGAPPPGVVPPNYALWADRAIAAFLDILVAVAVMVVAYIAFGAISYVLTLIAGMSGAAGRSGAAFGGLSDLGAMGACCMFFILPPIIYFIAGLYNKVYLVSKKGSSLGQGVMRVRIVTFQGGLVPLGTLLLRLLIECVFGLIPLVALLDLLWPLWDPQRQTLHDKAVGTFAIKIQ